MLCSRGTSILAFLESLLADRDSPFSASRHFRLEHHALPRSMTVLLDMSTLTTRGLKGVSAKHKIEMVVGTVDISSIFHRGFSSTTS